MTVRNAVNGEVAHPATKPIAPVSRTGMFARRWAESRRGLLVVLLLVSADVLFAFVVWTAAFTIQGMLGNGSLSRISVASTVPNLVVWVGLRAALGLYPGYGLSQVEELRRQTFALLATLTIVMVFAFASQIGGSLSRLLLFAWSLGLLLAAPVARHVVKRAMDSAGLWGKPVVILGAREMGAYLVRMLQREWSLGFRPVAVFDNRLAPVGRTLEGVPYEGTLTDAVAFARRHGVDTAIFAMPHTRREHLARFVDLISTSFRHTLVIPNLIGITNSAVVARDLAGTFGVEIKHNLLDPWAQRLKRALDVGAAVVGGACILPLLLLLCLLVWIESRGSVFYADRRMGKDGKLFSCVKFRTMVPDAESLLQQILAKNPKMKEEYLRYHKLRDDPRITRVGRFLRRTSLDELPQLWNVLRGDMSLVGPRPYLPRESDDIGEAQSEILRVTPGITGPWQVAGRNHTSFSDRVRMDAHYVRDWSVWLDFLLLAQTARCVLFNRDAY